MKRLGEVASIVNGGTPKTETPEFWDGGIPWITPKDLGQLSSNLVRETSRTLSEQGLKQSSAKLLPPMSVILSTRAPIGHLAINGVPMATNQGCRGLVPDVNLDARYLLLFLSSKVDLLNELGVGTTFKELAAGVLASVQIPIPPLAEQRRIVAVLDEAFAGLTIASANAEQSLADVRELFQVHLDLMAGQPRPEWAYDTLGQALRFVDYRGKTPTKVERGIRLITAKNVKMGYIQTYPEEFVHPDSYDKWMVRGFPKRGDVLFTTEAPLGNVAQLDTDERVVIGQRLITFQPVDNRIAPTFLKYALLSKTMQDLVRQKATGATVQGIKASLLKLIPICYPHDAAEQARIASRLDEMAGEVSKISGVIRRKLTLLAELRQSLLHRAFAGELA